MEFSGSEDGDGDKEADGHSSGSTEEVSDSASWHEQDHTTNTRRPIPYYKIPTGYPTIIRDPSPYRKPKGAPTEVQKVWGAMKVENYYSYNIKEELVVRRMSEEERIKNEETVRARKEEVQRLRREYEEEERRAGRVFNVAEVRGRQAWDRFNRGVLELWDLEDEPKEDPDSDDGWGAGF